MLHSVTYNNPGPVLSCVVRWGQRGQNQQRKQSSHKNKLVMVSISLMKGRTTIRGRVRSKRWSLEATQITQYVERDSLHAQSHNQPKGPPFRHVKDVGSMVIRLRQATIEFAPPPPSPTTGRWGKHLILFIKPCDPDWNLHDITF